jgi:excinuclease ABC subunit A
LGNTVIVVEHDEEAMRKADYLVDIGPGAGVHGGKIVAAGSYEDVLKNKKSITGQYLSGAKKIEIPGKRNEPSPEKMLNLTGASGNNLNDVSLSIPCGLLTCITGVSGSGKSTLINHTLYPLAATELNKATTLKAQPYEAIDGLQHLDKVVGH